jgi:hypothetical protein
MLMSTASRRWRAAEVWPSPREPDTQLCGFRCLETVAKLPLDRRNTTGRGVDSARVVVTVLARIWHDPILRDTRPLLPKSFTRCFAAPPTGFEPVPPP